MSNSNGALISREPIRTDIRRILLARLMTGDMKPGARINESTLAEELGVSRTPLREALIHLEFEGFVASEQGKGFTVVPMRMKTAQDLHSLVGLLEGIAVSSLVNLRDHALGALLDELEEVNQELAREAHKSPAPNHERVIELGNRWHSLLMKASDNEQLVEVLALLKARLFRYTYHFVGEMHRVEGTLDHHDAIVAALRTKNFTAAASLLREHWMTGADSRYEWLREEEQEERGQDKQKSDDFSHAADESAKAR